jgi:lysylphosphatidylglycerol synthetase-like protein (DUF2156 family)
LLAIYSVAASIFGMGLASAFGFFIVPLIILLFFFGFFSFLLAYGLSAGRRWAWIAAVILAIFGIAVSLIGVLFGSYLNIISLVFYLVILLYLASFSVRAFFGRIGGFFPPAPFPPLAYPPPTYAAPMPPMPTQYSSPPPPQPVYHPPDSTRIPRQVFQRTAMCPVCLSPVGPDALQCFRCGARLR